MISIVIPVFNSGGAMVRECHAALSTVLATMSEPAEIIFVDDGSRDDSLDALLAAQAHDPRVRIVELAANFGQHAAFSAGFEVVRGDVVVTMDVDLQADPADIPRLVAPIRNGYELVSGVRVGRRDPFMRRLASWIVTRLVTLMTDVRLADVNCPYNAFSARLAQDISKFGELRRFLKPLGMRIARSVTEVNVTSRPRALHHVRSSYSSTQLLRLFMDFFVNSIADVFAWVCAVMAVLLGVALIALAAVSFRWLAGVGSARAVMVTGATAVAISLIGLMGLIGDYVQRIYRQGSGRPFYLVRRTYEAPLVSELNHAS